MQNSKSFMAIDIGTTKVFTIIGRKSNVGRIEVLGYGVAPSDGVRKGVVEDVEATSDAIRQSVRMAAGQSGIGVTSAFVGISGVGVSYEKRVDTIDWVGEHGVITARELRRIPKSVALNGMPSGRSGKKVIHSIPKKYSIDGKDGVTQPLGMHTRKLDVETHLVAASETDVDRITRAVENAGISVERLVLESLASSESALTEEERVRGVAMIDIGGGTTDMMIYKNGMMQYSSVIPVGGFQFTNDICLVYNTTYEAAEEIKLSRAKIRLEPARVHEEVMMPVEGGNATVKVALHEICQLTRERAQELLRLIVLKLREGGVDNLADFRIVLAGGAANLAGLVELFKLGTSADVRLGKPLGYMDLPDELRSPAYSTGVGVMLWASYQDTDESAHRAFGKASVNHSGQHSENGNLAQNGRKGGILSMFSRWLTG